MLSVMKTDTYLSSLALNIYIETELQCTANTISNRLSTTE